MIKLEKHIAYKLLTDSQLTYDIVKHTYSDLSPFNSKVISFEKVINAENQKSFYCTETVLDKLDMLKITKRNDSYNWNVFSNIGYFKHTYILPDNAVLRVVVDPVTIHFVYITLDKVGYIKWVMFYVNKETGEKSHNFDHADVLEIEEKVYKLMCFIHLTENDEIIIAPKQKLGTKKSGKVINTLPFNLTMINSRWNTTTINNNAFSVKGHFAIRWSGEGRTTAKVVFIEPFEKKGYIRKAHNNI